MILEYLFCCKYTTDDKILDLLEDLATKRQKFINNFDSYNGDYYKLYQDILKYFKVKDSTNSQQKLYIQNWSSIRKKVIKDLILKNFIIEVKYKYNFEDNTANNLQRDLMIGLNYKNINDKNIIIKNNKIIRIEGLYLSINSYKFDYNIFSYD